MSGWNSSLVNLVSKLLLPVNKPYWCSDLQVVLLEAQALSKPGASLHRQLCQQASLTVRYKGKK